ncbi:MULTISPECIES: heavy metal-associated domain-containing protein [Streptomyces]|uniref:Heavy-metal-associated domain-containing protein n=1 Tax=Streptomyces rhizosphaericola TaxID=2564098 RepID=A0ABY2PMQ5_9ACTN|nr:MULTISPECIES: heavy metal-associated domain-containing protein [Streptomyces]NUW20653.1 heavy-metal-associated domain-containing protein [Streptomyces roseoviolaceus]MYT93323.1 heavy-metal-associated domain-containing protein [Streptomyces sp. SID8359]MYT99560.1 heavy-metal-associated domain-containing protein [Streptomyces sp. SID8350]NGO82769.1 heavy-metal-associated domain-containing protein [Streptomyces sp. 196(2019)]NUV79214.1 heavy-metal-associated domain-containing protein [Streptom
MDRATVFEVRGMTCGGCAKRIRTAIEADLGEDTAVAVDHRTGRVTVTSPRDVAPEAVRSAVERTGYEFAGTAA